MVARLIVLIQTLSWSSVHASAISGWGCAAYEREALISFKKSFLDPAGRFSSWRGKECCGWKGVSCSNATGRVVKLDLGSEDYPDSLTLIASLDMSWVDLSSASDWVQKVNMLPNLKTLILPYCGLSSTVSSVYQSNLTHLEILDLSTNIFDSPLQHNWFWGLTTIKNLILSDCLWSGPIPETLSNMSSLEVLYLDENDLTGIMPVTFKNLCSLRILHLERNSVNADILERLPECSWSKLRELYLQGAELTGKLPVWIGKLTSLSYLDISQNMIQGSIPFDIGNLTSLEYLDLSQNMLVGSVPFGIGNLVSLSYLNLSQNMLGGDVPDGMGALSNLTFLSFGLNNLSGMVSKGHFASLAKLDFLDLSQNSLKLVFSEDWIPPFRLKYGYFGSCDMGPWFPAWLRWQAGINYLEISNASIDGVLPHWFWVVFSNSQFMDLSRNQLHGSLPEKLELPYVFEIDLSSNSLSGLLPTNLTSPQLRILHLHKNQFSGTIPTYVCQMSGLQEINLSNNQLSGDFSSCQVNSSLSSAYNDSICIGSSLFMVDLKNNNLSGEFPRFFQRASHLSFLDLSHNKFSGSVPTWIAKQMPKLEVLILRSNTFVGHLPRNLTKLVGLHYLDVAHNNLSGSIPSSLAKMRAMADQYESLNNYTSDSISAFIKDRELNYTHEFIEHIVLIDLSSNFFSGHIPMELSLLKGLRSLNLSCNQISGQIPSDIGVLRELESLDLSYNYLTGEIPSSLSDLTFLSCLNLSYNDLSGRIPSGQQLQTLNDQYMYIGNPRLCGPPLLKNCSTNERNQDAHEEHEGTTHDLLPYYLSMSMGFVVGLWMVFCAMLFKKTWRITISAFWIS
ncbi:hypothetical protein ACP4OV_011519 [Aristida adscensionis]